MSIEAGCWGRVSEWRRGYVWYVGVLASFTCSTRIWRFLKQLFNSTDRARQGGEKRLQWRSDRNVQHLASAGTRNRPLLNTVRRETIVERSRRLAFRTDEICNALLFRSLPKFHLDFTHSARAGFL